MILVVPECLRITLEAKIDAQLEACPEVRPHREEIYRDLLAHIDEYGVIPEFTLKAK